MAGSGTMRHEQCINVELSDEQRKELLRLLVRRFGSIRKLAVELGVSKSSLHRLLKGEQVSGTIARTADYRLCRLMSEDEFYQIINRNQLLRSLGLLGDKGVNVPLLLALLDAVLDREEARNAVLELVAKRYKTELRQMLGEALPKIKLEWSEGFEKWLTEKKSKPISGRTLRDYRNIWMRCLEGGTLGWHTLKKLEGKRMECGGEWYSTGWARQVFRHYIRYLYSIGKLDWDTYTRLLLVIPGRRYGRRMSQKPIALDDVVRTLKVLREKRKDIYMLYLLMLFSAIRFEHALRMLRDWRPGEKVYVPYLNHNITRLECPGEFCRYYMGSERDRKPVGFAYFPRQLLSLIEGYRDKLPNKRRIEKVVARLGGLMPKYIRIYALREMKAVFGETDVWRFITSKFGELTVSPRHYMNLLEEADRVYSAYVMHIYEVLRDAVEI